MNNIIVIASLFIVACGSQGPEDLIANPGIQEQCTNGSCRDEVPTIKCAAENDSCSTEKCCSGTVCLPFQHFCSPYCWSDAECATGCCAFINSNPNGLKNGIELRACNNPVFCLEN